MKAIPSTPHAEVGESSHSSPNLKQHVVTENRSKDEALTILDPTAGPAEITPEQDRAVLRKIDLWIMPVILLVYFLQQLDK